MLGRRNPCRQLLPLLPLPHEALGFAASLRGQQCPRAKRSRGAPPPPMPRGWQCARHQCEGGPPVGAGPHRPSCQLSTPPAPASPHPPPLRSTAILLGEGISLDLLTSSCSGGWMYNEQLLLGGGQDSPGPCCLCSFLQLLCLTSLSPSSPCSPFASLAPLGHTSLSSCHHPVPTLSCLGPPRSAS